MSNCENCGGGCNSCSGCGKSLELHTMELAVLRSLGQYSFLPVARRADDMTPVYLEEQDYSPEEYSVILQCLEKKNLIRIDYDMPLKGADMEKYDCYPVHGSMALTQRGQQVLDILDTQGIA